MSGKLWSKEMTHDLATLRVMSDFTSSKGAELINMAHGTSITKEAVRKKIQRMKAEEANGN